MLQNYNKWAVLGVFFDDPLPEGGGFQLRELSRRLKLAPKSVRAYLDELLREGLLLKSKHRALGFPLYFGNRESERFRFYKKINTISMIFESGLLAYLADKCMPGAIVLFGSAARGEDISASDVDLFLLCTEAKLDLAKYEKKLGRSINVIFSKDFNQLSVELRNNIVNGIKLRGYLKVF